MSLGIRLVILGSGALIFSGVFISLVRRRLNESASLIWMVIGATAFLASIFPGVVGWLANMLGIDYPPTLVFVMAITALLLFSYHNTTQLAVQDAKIRELTIQLSLIKSEVKENQEAPELSQIR